MDEVLAQLRQTLERRDFRAALPIALRAWREAPDDLESKRRSSASPTSFTSSRIDRSSRSCSPRMIHHPHR